MMRIRNVLYTVMLFVSFYSCQNSESTITKKEDTLPIVNMDLNTLRDLTLSEILDSVRYIPLETSNESLIGKIDKIFFQNEKIIIVDKSITQSVYFFNNEGKFLSKIKAVGKGPGEYQIIKDVYLDDKNGILELYDSQSDNLIKYSLSGRFIGQQKLKYKFSSFVKIGDTYLVSTNKMINRDFLENEINFSFLSIDTSGNKIISTYFPYDPSKKIANRSFELQYPSFKFGNEIFITRLFCDTLYTYNNRDLKPLMVFDYGQYSLPYLSANDIPSDVAAELIFSDTEYAFGHTFNGITDSIMSFTYGYKNYTSNQYWCLLSRKTGNLYNFRSVINDVNPYKFNYPLTSINNSFVSAIDYIEPDKDILDEPAFQDFNIVSNPVLMIFKIKENL